MRILSFGAPPLRIAVASACPPSHWIELPLRKSLRRLPADLSSLLSATACRVTRGGRGERVGRGGGMRGQGRREGRGGGGGASSVQGGSQLWRVAGQGGTRASASPQPSSLKKSVSACAKASLCRVSSFHLLEGRGVVSEVSA